MAKKSEKNKKAHPWRLCPLGEHWVSDHSRRVSKGTTSVAGHCRANRSKKDQIYAEELNKISEKYFSSVRELPSPDNLEFKYLGNRYDEFIAGWTKYWNEVLGSEELLDPNLVKALIATESGFDRFAEAFAGKKAGRARGLMQVTDWTLEILRDENGELKDHLLDLSQKDMEDPNLGVAAGIRWLYRKRETASSKLGRKASWMEAAADYKSYLEDWRKNPDHKQMKRLQTLFKRLKK